MVYSITSIPNTRYNIVSVLYILEDVQYTAVEKDQAECKYVPATAWGGGASGVHLAETVGDRHWTGGGGA